jgi:hypothetical protein
MEPAKGLGPDPNDSIDTSSEKTRIAAVEEQVAVGVEKSETGALRVRRISREEEVDVPVTLRSEKAEVRRVAVNRRVEAEFGPRQEGDTLIIPVFEYVPVTEMRLMLKEEIHVRKHTLEEESVQTVQVRKDEVIVERREGRAGEWVVQDEGAIDS